MEKSNRMTGISEVLNSLFKNQKNMPSLKTVRLSSKWIEIVGQQLSLHTHPDRINQSILYVNCDHQGWISTLQFYKKEILNNIKQYFKGDIEVNDIKFFYGGKKRNF